MWPKRSRTWFSTRAANLERATMHTRTPLPFDAAKEGLSRRSLLGLTTAGLVAPLLQACGGGSRSATDLASVQWTRQTILEALNLSLIHI